MRAPILCHPINRCTSLVGGVVRRCAFLESFESSLISTSTSPPYVLYLPSFTFLPRPSQPLVVALHAPDRKSHPCCHPLTSNAWREPRYSQVNSYGTNTRAARVRVRETMNLSEGYLFNSNLVRCGVLQRSLPVRLLPNPFLFYSSTLSHDRPSFRSSRFSIPLAKQRAHHSNDVQQMVSCYYYARRLLGSSHASVCNSARRGGSRDANI